MKKLVFSLIAMFCIMLTMAQVGDVNLSKVSTENTWLKIGPIAGLNVVDVSVLAMYVVGLDVGVQFLETKASGIGLKTGISNYFTNLPGITATQEMPLAILYRFYPESTGFFGGVDLGYSLLFNKSGNSGGYMGRPQLGYHSNNWNFFLYYNYIAIGENNTLETLGAAATYNLRFRGGD